MSGPEEHPGLWISGSFGPVAGSGNTVSNIFHEAQPSVTWPVVVGRFPPPDPAFVERSDLDGEEESSQRVLAFTGDGGVGKTELAAARFRAGLKTADGVVPAPVVHAWPLAAVAAGVLVTANVLAAIPALSAARSRPGRVLRTE